MADYFRFSLVADRSAVSDYAPRKANRSFVLELTPDESMPDLEVEAVTSAGTTLNTTHLTAATALLVALPSTASANVTVTFSTAGTTGAAVVLSAGEFMFVPDFNPANSVKLVAASGTETVRLWITGT